MNKEFTQGIAFYKKPDNAPEWVVVKAKIIKKELLAWLETQPDVIRIDVKVSKAKGTLYGKVDTWKKQTVVNNGSGGGFDGEWKIDGADINSFANVPSTPTSNNKGNNFTSTAPTKQGGEVEYGQAINPDDIPF